MTAFAKQRLDVINLLVDHKDLDVSYWDATGCTYLMVTCLDSNLLPVARKLIKRGCGLDDIWMENGATALSAACSGEYDLEMVKLLLDSGANPDVCGENTQRPIVLAVMRGNYECAELLLKHGADITTGRNDDGFYLLYLATIRGRPEPLALQFIDLFVRVYGANCNAKSAEEGLTPLALMLEEGNYMPKVLRRYVELGTEIDATLVRKACEALPQALDERGEVLKFLLQMGADPNAVVDGQSHLQYLFSTPGKNLAWIRMLLAAGADAGPILGADMLCRIALQGNYELAELLLQLGADRGARINGKRAYDYAVVSPNADSKLRALLAEQDGDADYVSPQLPLPHTLPRVDFAPFSHCANCRQERQAQQGEEEVVDLSICAGCEMVAYCDQTCQRAHWRAAHKPICKAKQASAVSQQQQQ